MDIKIFTDLLDAIGKVFAGIKAIAKLPKEVRGKYRQTMEETYMLMDTTLSMIILRLGDIGLIENNAAFLDEARKLDNYDAWIKAEQEFRLCRNLRVAVSETEELSDKLLGKISAEDWKKLLEIMRSTLAAEGDVASYISYQFQSLAAAAGNTPPLPQEVKSIRDQVAAVRSALIGERQRLIRMESDLLLYTI